MAKIKNEITQGGGLVGGAGNALADIASSGLTSISPLNDVGRYMTGLRAIIKVNDKLFGFAFGVSINIKMDTEEIWTIDRVTPYELAPRKTIATGTIGLFHVPGRDPSRQNVHPSIFSFLFHRYISIEISDQTTGETIFKTDKAMVVNRSQNIDVENLSTIRLEWVAIEWENEATPKLENHDKDTSSSNESDLIPNFSAYIGNKITL